MHLTFTYSETQKKKTGFSSGALFFLQIGTESIYANLVNFEVYLKVPVSWDKMVKV